MTFSFAAAYPLTTNTPVLTTNTPGELMPPHAAGRHTHAQRRDAMQRPYNCHNCIACGPQHCVCGPPQAKKFPDRKPFSSTCFYVGVPITEVTTY